MEEFFGKTEDEKRLRKALNYSVLISLGCVTVGMVLLTAVASKDLISLLRK